MTGWIPRPAPGEQVSAQWGADVTDACNAIRNAGMPGMLARHGAGAFGNAPLPVNQRNRRYQAKDLGCFRIVTKQRSEETQEGTVIKEYKSIDNRYYSVGELVRHMEEEIDIDLDDLINQGDKPAGQDYSDDDKPFICLVVAANPDTASDFQKPRILGYHDFEEMAEAQHDTSIVVQPLYKLTHEGAVAIDFRTMPHLQVVEVI